MMCKFTHQGSNLMFEPHAEKLPFSKLPFLHASNARTASKCFSKCQASRHRERSERWTKVEDSIPSFDVWLLFGPLSTLSCSPLRLCQEGDALEPQVLTPPPPAPRWMLLCTSVWRKEVKLGCGKELCWKGWESHRCARRAMETYVRSQDLWN